MKKKVGHFNIMEQFVPEAGKKYNDNIVNASMFWNIAQPPWYFKSVTDSLKIEQLLKDDRNGFMVSTTKLHDRVETLVKKHDDPDFHFLVAYFFAEYGEEESIKLGLVQHSLAVKQFIAKNRTSVFLLP